MNSPAGTSTNRGSSSSRIGRGSVYSPACASSPSRWSGSSPPGSTRCASTCPRAACIRSASASWSATGAALDAVLDQPLIYTQTNGTEALRTAIAALYPGASAGPRRGDQRRGRGQLPRRLVSGAARRRGGGARAHLHADARPGARLRRRRARVAARRGPRGRTLASGSRSARRRWSVRAPAPSCCARPTTRPAPASPPRSSTRSRPSPRGTAAGSSPTRSTAAPSSTASTRRRCGAAASG